MACCAQLQAHAPDTVGPGATSCRHGCRLSAAMIAALSLHPYCAFLCERRRCLLSPVKGVLTRHKRKVVAPGDNGEQAARLNVVLRAAIQRCPGA